ncbi:MAG: NADH-quinone oxidoreductase subunit L [Legionellales bacterium RIFCSPHIGHO2_12_FULL_37_14]|nr:MAG: NADH-quinone oxidoreductase subunit L [Legionellales bacterium RIFCSPHIGHO2_12_FULL_37_14]
MSIEHLCFLIVFLPLIGSIGAGFFAGSLGRAGAHTLTIFNVFVAFILSLVVAYEVFSQNLAPINVNLYTWISGGIQAPYAFNLGFLIDSLTAVMLVVVTFISLLVHIYSIGYMADDSGYSRFFSYISLFTFMMLMLVSANNFLQLFFGWEGVGLVSYLLIGFWFQRESALQGSLKAFLVNRVGDFGFILGLGLILSYAGSLDYAQVLRQGISLQNETMQIFFGHNFSVVTVISLCLFVGAMGKSAQVPLHVWLPESMEGPTPISALIHAATMVTAGVFMVARVSPLIEYSDTALTVIMVIGATGALFTGALALVMNDIKRVIAYSTLSQLGYMMVAMGASAYSAGIFHLATHACFKALLFLAAGSVIIAMHHEQDMRKMGGLAKKMPITYWTFLIGTLALCAFPPFAGYYSKDTIIDAVKISTLNGHTYAYFCVLIGAMVTAMYSFRALFMTFHGAPKMDMKTYNHVHETPMVVWGPLVILAIPSICLGYLLFMPMLYKNPQLLGDAIFVLPQHDVLLSLANEIHGPLQFALEAFLTKGFWVTILGVFIVYYMYMLKPNSPAKLTNSCASLYQVLVNKYGFDAFNDFFFVKGGKKLGEALYQKSDQGLIDGAMVNGTAKIIAKTALIGRLIQTGYLFHYAAMMVFGVFAFLVWFLVLH